MRFKCTFSVHTYLSTPGTRHSVTVSAPLWKYINNEYLIMIYYCAPDARTGVFLPTKAYFLYNHDTMYNAWDNQSSIDL